MMRKLFETGERYNILALYNKNPDVIYAEPKGTEHIAHVTYLRTKAESSIDAWGINYFLIKEPNVKHDKKVKLRKDFYVGETNKHFGIVYEITKKFKDLEEIIVKVACQDVRDFTEDRKPRYIRKTGIEYVDEIKSKAQLIVSGHANVEASGKQSYFPDCLLDLNIDFADWCQSNITPDGKLDSNGTCEYCYAGSWHRGYPYVYEVTEEGLTERIRSAKEIRAKEGLQTRYIRLGKRTDAGADFFADQIKTTLKVAHAEGLKAIFPTKYLKFDQDIARLLKLTESTLLYSFGNDEIEKGTTSHGRTQEWRFNEARKYLAAGVRAVPYVLIDPTREDAGYFSNTFYEAIKFPKALLMPIRIKNKNLAGRVLGGWDVSVGRLTKDLFGTQSGGFELEGGTLLHKDEFHPSIERLVKERNGEIGICSHNIEQFWCNGCFMPGHEQIVKLRGKK